MRVRWIKAAAPLAGRSVSAFPLGRSRDEGRRAPFFGTFVGPGNNQQPDVNGHGFKTVLGAHFGIGEFTTHFRLPILVVGLNRMFTGRMGS